MFYIDFSNFSDKVLKKLSIAVLPDSFYFAALDEHNHIVHHEYLSDIRYSQKQTQQQIQTSLSPFLSVNDICVTCMNDFTFQSEIRDDDILKILPSTQHKVNMLERLPVSEVYNYFQLSPSQEDVLNSLGKKDSYKIRDLVSVLSSYHSGETDSVIHIHLENQRAFIYGQSNGKVVFYKSLLYQQKEDVLYYALSARSFINDTSYKTFCSGTIAPDSPMFQLLLKFTENAVIVKDNDSYVDKSGYTSEQFHYYFIHFAATL